LHLNPCAAFGQEPVTRSNEPQCLCWRRRESRYLVRTCTHRDLPDTLLWRDAPGFAGDLALQLHRSRRPQGYRRNHSAQENQQHQKSRQAAQARSFVLVALVGFIMCLPSIVLDPIKILQIEMWLELRGSGGFIGR
jgi:hypothetical protein